MKGYIKLSLVLTALAAFATDGRAESPPGQDQDALTASARIRLQVVIPEVLHYQISTTDALVLPGPSALLNSGQALGTSSRETADEIIYTTTSL